MIRHPVHHCLGFSARPQQSEMLKKFKPALVPVPKAGRCDCPPLRLLRFVGAVSEHQPSLGNLLLTDVVCNTGIFDYVGTDVNESAVLSSAFALLVEIWDQGRAKRDSFLAKIGDRDKQRAFWEKILRPLQGIDTCKQCPIRPDLVVRRSVWDLLTAIAWKHALCTQLLAYQMMVPDLWHMECWTPRCSAG